jgi:uncharacterized protein (TIGR00297 family)
VSGWTLIAAAVAALVVAIARRSQSLSRGGAIAALVLGVICTAAGWSWAAVLVGFFVAASVVSRFRSERKERRIADIVEKGGERDALQVLANGGIFSAAALGSLVHGSPVWVCIGAGAIAASSADTWSTEIGVLSESLPRSIVTGRTMTPGESGGVTWLGTIAGLGGALVIAIITILAGWGAVAALTAIMGGFTGCIVDSVLGGTLQARRWCDHCNRATERTIHGCGTTTRTAGGLPWLTNDSVNALSSASGALIGLLCYLTW